ncbi:MAG: ATP-dependent DNA helicase RecG [Dehalococcoidia bacterium]|nr:ATP-dependent DNA helicase RecG [Dehalococcoidia bacterium]
MAFLRILRLEQSRNFDDQAVFGGLDKFLARWQAADAAHAALQHLAQGKLLELPYASLSAEARSLWISAALEALGAATPAPSRSTPLAAPAEPRRRRPAAAAASLSLDQPATALRSITPRVRPPLDKLGVKTVRDLVYLFPRRHNEVRTIAQLRHDEDQAIVATIWEARRIRLGRSLQAAEAVVGDDTGNIRVVWYNQPYLAQRFKPGSRYVLSGRVSIYRGGLVLDSPEYEEMRPDGGMEPLVQPGRLFPVYPLTEGITQQTLRRIVRKALARAVDAAQDILPNDILERQSLLPVRRALWQAHYPDSQQAYEAARRRLAFEELFLLQLGVLARRRQEASGATGVALSPPPGVVESFLGSLPFQLTQAQRRVLGEVLADMAGGDRPMSRLLQGEVGSGKTVVALAALLVAVACGYQGAIMAPTEVLAEQHFLTVKRLLEGLAHPLAKEYLLSVYLDPFPRPVMVGLLLGSMTAASKKEVRRLLAAGSLDLAIGTHALIQEDVDIPKLALAVVDEQHRFGVMQRAALRQMGQRPHLLVMSATPIPRTLALTLYGDLDLSTIDELPPGRQRIRTRVVSSDRRTPVYDFIRKEVQAGRQGFAIYPLIDESEAVNARAAVKEHERLATDVFPDLRVGLLHGRMPMREKQEVMDKFRRGDIDVLVSTPVVEVGIDVPNATVMLIEGADRFGLAQLHQFRGRVGRGQHASYCILVAESPSEEARERLAAMEKIEDGFKLAEVDLELRGPGDYFGTRQSGLPDLRMARLTDAELLTLARKEAQALLEADPELSLPEHAALKEAMARFTAPVGSEVG